MEPLTFHRRALLQAAAGLALPLRPGARPKSLLTVWLEGGASQLETWDPHPGGVIGGRVKAIATAAPGIQLADLYPQVAGQMQALSVIRSLVSREGDHERGTYAVKTGNRPEPGVVHPSLGALVTYLAPSPEGRALPPHVSLGKSPWPARGGMLGAAFDAFKVADPGRAIDNLAPVVSAPERQDRRLANLRAVSGAFAAGHPGVEPRLGHDATLGAALQMMRSDQLQALRVDDEPAAVKAAYGDSPFGRGCLVARRLLEQGVRAVEVSLGSFDSHTSNHEWHREKAAVLDPALASLVRELGERRLLETTVVLVVGEFGRTPRINAAEGRDHWPHAFSCLLGGGGLRGGRVVGETDPAGAQKDPKDPVGLDDLTATVLTALGHDPGQQLESADGRPIALSKGTAVRRLQ